MKTCLLLAVLSLVTPLLRAADPAFMGRWETPRSGSDRLVLSISKLGDFFILNQQWNKPGASSSATARYVLRGDVSTGTLDLHNQPNVDPNIPRQIGYGFEGKQLVLTVGEGTFQGTHRLERAASPPPPIVAKAPGPRPPATKSPPTQSTATSTGAKKSNPASPAAPAPATFQQRVLGEWRTAEGTRVRASMHFSQGFFDEGDLIIGQEWWLGAQGAISTHETYKVVADGTRATLTSEDKMEFTPDLEAMKVELRDDILIVEFQRGLFVGRHELRRVKKPESR